MKPHPLLALLVGLTFATLLSGAEPAVKTPPAPDAIPAKKERTYPVNPTPTAADVRYGEHERNVLDF